MLFVLLFESLGLNGKQGRGMEAHVPPGDVPHSAT
jgi:hypothetical protein